MSTSRLMRGMLLLEQNRYDLAEQEFRALLAEETENAVGHRLLAICLAERERFDEARAECEVAIHLEPTDAENHRVRGSILSQRGLGQEARASVDEALRLDPGDPDIFALSSHLHFEKSRWAEALADAEQGLRLDPEHTVCVNLRAQALVKLGRRDEANHSLDAALRRNPEDASTHANQGWTLLNQGQPRRAMEHFREALRLEPGYEWARMGIVESLKARNFLYRWLLNWFFWLSRFPPRIQLAIVVGIFFGQQLVARQAEAMPRFALVLNVVWIAMVAFAISTWLASPLFNLLLFTDRFGRLALSNDERYGAICVGAILVTSACLMGVGGLFGLSLVLICGFFLALSALPASTIFVCPAGRNRWILVATTAVVAGLALTPLAMFGLLMAGAVDFKNASRLASWSVENFGYAVLASQLIANGVLATPQTR